METADFEWLVYLREPFYDPVGVTILKLNLMVVDLDQVDFA